MPNPVVPADKQDAYVLGLYVRLLGREPGPGEIEGWKKHFTAAGDPAAVAAGIARSSERKGRLVKVLYRDLLGREARESDVKYWMGTSYDVESIAEYLCRGAEYVALPPIPPLPGPPPDPAPPPPPPPPPLPGPTT